MKKRKSGILAATRVKYLHSIVWCPCGEMEYLHQCGSLLFDLFIAQLYGDSMQTIKNYVRDDLQKVVGIFDDYFESRFARIVEDPNWKVRPTIVFENAAPEVLTCQRHRFGGKGRNLHQPHNS